jgi:cholesterol oxidase
VTVLERGKWWPAGPNIKTVPSFSQPDDGLEKALWYGTANVRGAYTAVTQIPRLLGLPFTAPLYAGLLDAAVNLNLTVVTAAGVGGGSLVSQGMTLQPTEALFNRVMPTGIDYHEMDDIYYPRLAQMLKIATALDELINSTNYRAARTFKQNALNAGYSVDKIPMPIDWSFPLRELNGEMTPSYTNGDCALCVNNGGKHSVDVTYLQQSMATGLVTVEALHNVTNVARVIVTGRFW